MFRKHSRAFTILSLTFLLVMLFVSSVEACSLALHDWKLLFFAKIRLNAPLFPLAELNAVDHHLKDYWPDKVFWVSNHNSASKIASRLFPLVGGWASRINWIPLPKEESVIKLAQSLSHQDNPPAIIGSDENLLKIAFFSDKNSDFRCHQLVVFQENRIRGVYPSRKNPWAKEIKGMSWFSLIFYETPLPGKIMSLAISPVRNGRTSLFEDHPFVEQLLADKKLKRRPELLMDPYSNDFPDLPE